MAKVSIISSVYNKGPWLERCLESLINQTFSDIEIIIVDNGATDNSAEIIEIYRKKDSRIKVITLEKNIGPSGGIAVGIDNVTSDYFGLCDADDYVEANYVEVLYDHITRHNADMSMCTNDYVYSDGRLRINKRPGKDVVFNENNVKMLLPQLLCNVSDEYLGYYLAEVGVEWAKLYRTSLVKQSNINYERNAGMWCDWLFNFRFIKVAKKIVYTEDTVYHNFMSEGSFTRAIEVNHNKIDEVAYVLRRFDEESIDVLENSDKLAKAQLNFYYRTLIYLIDYYKSFYGNLTVKDEKMYLKRICNMPTAKIVFDNIDNFEITLKRKIKLNLLKKNLYFAEIISMIIHELKRRIK